MVGAPLPPLFEPDELDEELELLEELEDELELLELELELEPEPPPALELELLELDDDTVRTTMPASVPLSTLEVTAMLKLVSVTLVMNGGGI